MATATALIARLDQPREIDFRVAPHNLDAEQALLGAILVNNDAFYRVSDFLLPEHFFEDLHRRIYETTGDLVRRGKIATPITLKTFLVEQDLGGISVPQYLARLAAEATTVINAEGYGRMVYDLAVRRQLIGVGEDLVNMAYDSPVDMPPREQIEDAERKLYDLAEKGRYEGGFQPFKAPLTDAMNMIANAFQRGGGLSGISSGLRDMDAKLGGFQPSDLVILAGRPGMGKTALATNIAFNMAKAWRGEKQSDGTIKTIDGARVGFFSLEMSSDQLATRIVAEQSGISSYKMRQGKITENEFAKLSDVAGQIELLPFYIDQTGGLAIAQLAARARRLKRQKGLDIMFVDYLQLLSGSSKKGENRVQELTEITTSLKALAKELVVPIVALSQLSRQVESRDDKRPQLSDLRESGSIEQDADVVMFVYREEYYLKNKEPKPGSPEFFTWQTEMELVHGLAEVIIGKQRHGPTGTVQLNFEGELTRFGDRADDSRLPERL